MALFVSEDNCILCLRIDVIECPSCHILFTQNSIVLSLPIPVLKYLEKYVSSTHKADLKPLHEMCHVLRSGFRAELRLRRPGLQSSGGCFGWVISGITRPYCHHPIHRAFHFGDSRSNYNSQRYHDYPIPARPVHHS